MRQELREEHIQKTVELSKKAFYKGLEVKECTWFEFIVRQLKFVRKRWWLFQFFILAFLWGTIYFGGGEPTFQRQASVLIPMFGLLIVPELWKNVRNSSVEVENAACFTLREIYVARLTMFALVDLLLLTVFFTITALTIHFTLLDIIVHFLIPLNVTICICFGILCGRHFNSEYAAVGFCAIWVAIWYRIISVEQLYNSISGVIWVGLMLLTLVGMFMLGKQLLKTSQGYSEGYLLWN